MRVGRLGFRCPELATLASGCRPETVMAISVRTPRRPRIRNLDFSKIRHLSSAKGRSTVFLRNLMWAPVVRSERRVRASSYQWRLRKRLALVVQRGLSAQVAQTELRAA